MAAWPHSPRRALAMLCAAALLLALVNGCSPEGASTSIDFGTNDPSVVVALGDSITFGQGDPDVESCDDSQRGDGGFCPRLQRLIGKTVVNEGICGETSYGGLARVRGVLQRWRPGVLLIDYSPNDYRLGADVTLTNLRGIIAAARGNKTVPVLGTLTPTVAPHEEREPYIRTVNAGIRELCTELDVVCADHYKAFVTSPAYRTSPSALLDDGIHPNAPGYELMARTWFSAAEDVLSAAGTE